MFSLIMISLKNHCSSYFRKKEKEKKGGDLICSRLLETEISTSKPQQVFDVSSYLNVLYNCVAINNVLTCLSEPAVTFYTAALPKKRKLLKFI